MTSLTSIDWPNTGIIRTQDTYRIPCPCCGTPMDADLNPDRLIELVAANGQRIILRTLIAAMPNYVPKERLVGLIYGYDSPLGAENNIETQICKLRTAIRSSAYRIRCARFVGYRLERKFQ